MIDDFTLFDAPAPPSTAEFDGAGYLADDRARLTGQLRRVWQVMSDGNWRSVNQIVRLTGDPANSVQAQLRHLRKEKFGAYDVQRRRATESGLYEYRVGAKGAGVPMTMKCRHCEEARVELDNLKAAIGEARVYLLLIANEDWRGNRPLSAINARAALDALENRSTNQATPSNERPTT